MIKVCADIVNELIANHDAGKDSNLNGLKQRYSRKYKVQNQPKLVDIIAAIPDQYRAALLPNLKAKPVRTASGVSFFLPDCHQFFVLTVLNKAVIPFDPLPL